MDQGRRHTCGNSGDQGTPPEAQDQKAPSPTIEDIIALSGQPDTQVFGNRKPTSFLCKA